MFQSLKAVKVRDISWSLCVCVYRMVVYLMVHKFQEVNVTCNAVYIRK